MFLHSTADHPCLHSFPTRRSSDLRCKKIQHRALPRPEDALAMTALLTVKDLQVEFHTRDGIVKAVNGVTFSLERDRKSTRLNSSHRCISYAVFCLKKKKKTRLSMK